MIKQEREYKMEQVLLTISIAALFLLRIGVPVIILITLGVVVDHWQANREPKVQDASHKPA